VEGWFFNKDIVYLYFNASTRLIGLAQSPFSHFQRPTIPSFHYSSNPLGESRDLVKKEEHYIPFRTLTVLT